MTFPTEIKGMVAPSSSRDETSSGGERVNEGLIKNKIFKKGKD